VERHQASDGFTAVSPSGVTSEYYYCFGAWTGDGVSSNGYWLPLAMTAPKCRPSGSTISACWLGKGSNRQPTTDYRLTGRPEGSSRP